MIRIVALNASAQQAFTALHLLYAQATA